MCIEFDQIITTYNILFQSSWYWVSVNTCLRHYCLIKTSYHLNLNIIYIYTHFCVRLKHVIHSIAAVVTHSHIICYHDILVSSICLHMMRGIRVCVLWTFYTTCTLIDMGPTKQISRAWLVPFCGRTTPGFCQSLPLRYQNYFACHSLITRQCPKL